ncbi:DNA helicase [Ordospora colligata]|nr:DNA helicase [Ordospora colligata]
MRKEPSVGWKDTRRSSKKGAALNMIDRQNVSNIEFWNTESRNPLHSENSSGGSDIDMFFTSTEHVDAASQVDPQVYSKFVVKKIERSDSSVVLIGDTIECHVSGEWCDIDYRVNMKITVVRCMCCDHQEDASSIDFVDEIFDSDRDDEYSLNRSSNESGKAYIDTSNTDQNVCVDSHIIPADYLNKESRKQKVYVNNHENYLLIEDDPISITTLCESLNCRNKHYLSSKVASVRFTHVNLRILIGVIAHSVLQNALIYKNFRSDFLIMQAKKAVSENVLLMHRCGVHEKLVLNEILKLVRNIQHFQGYKIDIVETEKKLTSLLFSIKGNADAIGRDAVLEIKVSKALRAENRAQVILYSLMLSEKTGNSFAPYIYYIPSKELVDVKIKHREVRSLLNMRNRISLERGLQKCVCNDEECRILGEISALDDLHFLKRQLNAIDEEESKSVGTMIPISLRYQSTTIVGLETEESFIIPRCIHLSIFSKDMVRISRGVVEGVEGNNMLVRLSDDIRLNKEKMYASFGDTNVFFKFMRFSLMHVAYPRYCTSEVLNGFCLSMEKSGLDINASNIIDFSINDKSNRCLDKAYNEDVSEEFNSFAFYSEDDEKQNGKIEAETNRQGICTISMDIASSAYIQTNIKKIVHTNHKREMVFEDSQIDTEKICIPEKYKHEFLKLNDDQRSALFLSLNCKNYRIIHGMPGTGKSMLITLMIKILVHCKKKVLLVCYTNLALRNIVEKLKGVNAYMAGKEDMQFENTDDAKMFFDNIELVCGTCFSFSDPVYVCRKFDFCVIDEGSQMHLLLALIPVSISERFVIVGDHLQLKPLSKSSKELSLSLFEYLLGNEYSKLRVQYRMGKEIMRLSNTLFYGNQLRGGERPSRVEFLNTEYVDIVVLVSSLSKCTILCYFNAQADMIRKHTSCTVETVDRFQGSEDDKVVVVFDPVSCCEVMESSERLNVALTRAKKHLVLVGNRSKMAEVEILKKLLDIL